MIDFGLGGLETENPTQRDLSLGRVNSGTNQRQCRLLADDQSEPVSRARFKLGLSLNRLLRRD